MIERVAARYRDQLAPAIERVWIDGIAQIRADLREWLRRMVDSPWLPIRFELAFGLPDTGGRGVLVSSYVESSNVDMAQEFTSMILAQRGFQASARMITTSDEMLQELVNLKR